MTDTVYIKSDIELALAILRDGADFKKSVDGRDVPCSKRFLMARVRGGRDILASMFGCEVGPDKWAWEVLFVNAGVDCYQFVGPSLGAAKALMSAKAIGAEVRRPSKRRKALRDRTDIL